MSLMQVVQTIAILLFAVSVVKLVFVPLALWFEARLRTTPWRRARLRAGPGPGVRGFAGRSARRRSSRHLRYLDGTTVSVIIPAYNEGIVLRNCVDSVMRSDYPHVEVIIVNDGSTDDTGDVMADIVHRHPSVRAIHQANAGKGAALNRGIAEASGDVLLFVDADGLFTPRTIDWLLVGLSSPDVGAVCGDDRPANPDRPLTQMLSVMSHVGTGLVRRALSLLHCLPIVSGNIGAFRASLVREIGGFREDTIGEDLELTWRVYAAGYRVVFQPRAIVYAESPSTLRGLWRQRVRWSRGLLQTTRIHWRLIGNPNHGVFGSFLALNTFAMIIAPPSQMVVLIALGGALLLEPQPAAPEVMAVLSWLGVFLSLALVLLAIVLNAAWRDLRYLWTLPFWPIYSMAMGLTMVTALVQEVRGAPARWNKLQRTGVVTGGAVAGMIPAGKAA